MGIGRDPRKPFAFTRVYGLVSLAAVLATTVALSLLYRELSILTTVAFGEQSNLAIANTALNAVLPQIAETVGSDESGAAVAPTNEVYRRLSNLITGALRDTSLERIKIYNKDGIILYSTRAHEIGVDDSDNPRFQGAIAGEVRSQLRYRDIFDLFAPASQDDNLIETYVPIRHPGIPKPIGVFEIYTDLNAVVWAMAHNELLILAGIAAIMMILYGVLLYVVRRSDEIIRGQRQVILERNKTLEILSGRMLATEETERRRIAWELHEDIVQTLGAIKMRIEALESAAATSQSLSGRRAYEGVAGLVQDVIRDIRALAMDVHPPTLDDFGLVATTRALCREAEQVSGQLNVASHFNVRDEDIPNALKGIIYRVVQQTLARIVRTPGINEVRVAIDNAQGLQLSVSVRFRTGSGEDEPGAVVPTRPEDLPIMDIWERAVLAGASFSTRKVETGHMLYEAIWAT